MAYMYIYLHTLRVFWYINGNTNYNINCVLDRLYEIFKKFYRSTIPNSKYMYTFYALSYISKTTSQQLRYYLF